MACAGLAIDGALDRGIGETTQALADAASTSAATFWAAENPTKAPEPGDGVGASAAAIAAVNGLPVATGNACTGTALTYDVSYYDVSPSAGSCQAASGWKSRLEIRIPPVPLPVQCTADAYLCVQVIATQKVHNTMMAILGQSTTTVAMQSIARVRALGAASGASLGIMALASTGEHSIYAARTGSLQINGDVFDNIQAPLLQNYCYFPSRLDDQPPTGAGGCPPGDTLVNYTDGLDTASQIVVSGTLTTVANNPLDLSFGLPSEEPASPNNLFGSAGYDPTLPAYAIHNAEGGTIAYGGLSMLNPMVQVGVPPPNTGQVVTNPIVATYGAPPTSSTLPGCPGLPLATFNSQASSAGPFAPGVYTFSLDVTGSAGAGAGAPTFTSCPSGQPGTYIFEKGVNLHPPSGNQVYGSNVLFITQNPIANLVLANNVGDGAPIGSGGAGGFGGTGLNLSVAMGGQGTINLTAPSTGNYKGLLLWQVQTSDSGAATRGNFGLNTAGTIAGNATDSATITLNGLIGNTTMGEQPGKPSVTDLQQYYGNDGGIDCVPYDPGGVLFSGQPPVFGASAPSSPNGTNTINGSAVVDIFHSDGPGATIINAEPSEVTGPGTSSGATTVLVA